MAADDAGKLRVRAQAHVLVTLELPEEWPDNFTIAEVTKQAKETTAFLLRELFEAARRGDLRINDVKSYLRGTINQINIDTIVMSKEEKR